MKDQHLGQREREHITHRHNQQCEKNEVVDKKRRQGRPNKKWKDDLDNYLMDQNWQETAQDRLTWRRQAEAFVQTTGYHGCPMMITIQLLAM